MSILIKMLIKIARLIMPSQKAGQRDCGCLEWKAAISAPVLLSVCRQGRAHLWHRGPVVSRLQQDSNSVPVCLKQMLSPTKIPPTPIYLLPGSREGLKTKLDSWFLAKDRCDSQWHMCLCISYLNSPSWKNRTRNQAALSSISI